MLIGYARVSKADGSQSLDLQRDALLAEGVDPGQIYEDYASGAKDHWTGLEACLRALRDGDVLVIWKLDRLGRNLAHLVGTVQDLSDRGVGLRVLAGQGAQIDTTSRRRTTGVRHLRGAGGVRDGSSSASARWRDWRPQGRVAGRAAGNSRCPRHRCASPRRRWRVATPRWRSFAGSWASAA